MIRRPPRSTQSRSSAASDVYKRQGLDCPVPPPEPVPGVVAPGGGATAGGGAWPNPKKGKVLAGVCGTARMRPPLLTDGPRTPPKWDIPIRVAVRTVAVPNAATAKVGVKVAVGRGRTTISRNGFRRPNSPRTSIAHDFSTHPG